MLNLVSHRLFLSLIVWAALLSKRYAIKWTEINAFQALIIAHNIERYYQITQNTIAIVFLATPHRGANLANILKTILNVSFSETEYVEDLSPDSQTIKDINDAFADRSKGLELASFWESTGMELAGVYNNHFLTLTSADHRARSFCNIRICWRGSCPSRWESFYNRQIFIRTRP